MGAVILLIYFALLTVGLAYTAGVWGLGIAAIVLLAYVVARELTGSRVIEAEERRYGREGSG